MKQEVIKQTAAFNINGQIRRMLFQTVRADNETVEQAKERLEKVIQAMRKKKAC